jgi:hypothetical protein
MCRIQVLSAMHNPQRTRHALLHWVLHGLAATVVSGASAQSSGRFPDAAPEPEAPAPVRTPRPAMPPPPAVRAAPPAHVRQSPRPPAAPRSAGTYASSVPAASVRPAPVAPSYYQPAALPVAATAAPFAPAVLPYRDGSPVPDGYRLEKTRVTGLMTAGGVVLGAGYATALGLAAAHDFSGGNAWLAVPLIGPWVALTKRESPCDIDELEVRQDAEECVDAALDEAALVAAIAVDGLFQAIGAGLFLGGAIATRQQLVRKDVAQVRVMPRRVGRTGYGVGLQARF